MSDAQAPLISLQVDQEVFIDTVRAGDVIDDATVATEVTSFERAGDAYVLEGAVVFAGYMKRAQENASSADSQLDALAMGFDNVEHVEHVHHRTPFLLRVPVKSQSRGIVNVASRISSWKLEVVGTGWVRVVADLTVVGLNGEQGYHFQCGAQEAGDLFFLPETSVQSTGASGPARSDAAGEPQHLNDAEESGASLQALEEEEANWADVAFSRRAETAEQIALVRGSSEDAAGPEDARSFDASAQVNAKFEAISQARGGQQGSDGAGSSGVEPLTESNVSLRAKDDLADFDRAFQGVQSEGGTAGADSQVTQPPANWASVAEFEFEHQLSSAELEASTNVTAKPGPAEAFVASRSFSENGFRAAEGFVPTIRVSGQPNHEDSVRTDTQPAPVELQGQAVEDEYRGEGTKLSSDLWSFVDFNAPEQRYTMRFAVVMDEETLDSLSERLACTKADLIRVNRLATESVQPGQAICIPGTAHYPRV